MSYIIAVIISLISVQFSLYFLDQNFKMYFDDVAIAVVIGCTFAISVIVLPWKQFRTLSSRFYKLFFPGSLNQTKLVKECLNYIQNCRSGSYAPSKSKHLAHRVLTDGQEMIELRFTPEEIESILHERVHHEGERVHQIAAAFANLAKYPPAFGLIGTVFGLVNLMRAISDGLDPTQTGLKMAIALVATLYGLVLANLVIAPIGELIRKQAAEERQLADIAMQAVLLASQNISLLKSQEMLNSFIPKEKRINFIKGAMESGDAA